MFCRVSLTGRLRYFLRLLDCWLCGRSSVEGQVSFMPLLTVVYFAFQSAKYFTLYWLVNFILFDLHQHIYVLNTLYDLQKQLNNEICWSSSRGFFHYRFGESYGGGLIVAHLAWPSEWVVIVGAFLSTFGAAIQSLIGVWILFLLTNYQTWVNISCC